MRGFFEVVSELDEGKVRYQLDEALADVVRGVTAARKGGAVTIVLTVKQQDNMLQVSASVKKKVPQPATEAQLYFASDDGELRSAIAYGGMKRGGRA